MLKRITKTLVTKKYKIVVVSKVRKFAKGEFSDLLFQYALV